MEQPPTNFDGTLPHINAVKHGQAAKSWCNLPTPLEQALGADWTLDFTSFPLDIQHPRTNFKAAWPGPSHTERCLPKSEIISIRETSIHTSKDDVECCMDTCYRMDTCLDQDMIMLASILLG